MGLTSCMTQRNPRWATRSDPLIPDRADADTIFPCTPNALSGRFLPPIYLAPLFSRDRPAKKREYSIRDSYMTALICLLIVAVPVFSFPDRDDDATVHPISLSAKFRCSTSRIGPRQICGRIDKTDKVVYQFDSLSKNKWWSFLTRISVFKRACELYFEEQARFYFF